MKLVARLPVCALALLFLTPIGGCGDNGKSDAGSGGAGGTAQGAMVTVTCTDAPGDPVCDSATGTVDAPKLDNCSLSEGRGTLYVSFTDTGGAKDPQQIDVVIEGFTGNGQYDTSTAGTKVTLQGSDLSSHADSTGASKPCTIQATSNLADIKPPEGAGLLNVTLDVSCPGLTAGGACEVVCATTPFTLTASGCDLNP